MPKRDIAPIVNGRVQLRLLRESDLPTTRAWRNQDHIRRWFFTSDVISEEQHRAWFEGYRHRDDDFVFVIEETDTIGGPVGQAALYHVDWQARRAEFGRLMIGEAAATGLGLGRLATSALTRFALTSWDLEEVYLDVLETNAKAIAVYEQCGFVAAGRTDGSLHMTCTAAP
jgi:RimJ/RimL family protein N-acetyltransferase